MRIKLKREWVTAAILAALPCATFAQATPVGEVVAVPAKAAVCAACHGEKGQSTIALNPVIAGLSSRYLYLQLRDFKEGRRKDPQMSPMAADLTKQEMRDLADYFSSQKMPPSTFKPDAEKVRLGKAKADETLCTMCHLGGFLGQNEIPRVAGQHYEYVVKQLRDFKARQRTNDAGNMTSVSNTLSDDDIVNLGHYLAGL